MNIIEQINQLSDVDLLIVSRDPRLADPVRIPAVDLKLLTAEIARKDEALAEYEAMLADEDLVLEYVPELGESIFIDEVADGPHKGKWFLHGAASESDKFDTALDAYKALAALRGE